MTDEIINFNGLEFLKFDINNLIDNPCILIYCSENINDHFSDLFKKFSNNICEFDDISFLDTLDKKLNSNKIESCLSINCKEITEKIINQPPLSSLLYSNKLYNTTLILTLKKHFRLNPYILNKVDYVFISSIHFYGDLREIYMTHYNGLFDYEAFITIYNEFMKNNLILVFTPLHN